MFRGFRVFRECGGCSHLVSGVMFVFPQSSFEISVLGNVAMIAVCGGIFGHKTWKFLYLHFALNYQKLVALFGDPTF